MTRSKPSGRTRSLRGSERLCGYLFIAPTVLGVFVFSVIPILFSFGMSFTDWDSITEPVFIGLQNYRDMLADPEIRLEVRNTLLYTLGTVPLTLLLSLLLANALNKKLPGKGVFRTLYFLPVVTMPVAVAMVWRWLLNSEFGVVNQVLGFFGVNAPMWLGDPKYVMTAIILVVVWSQVGYNMIILLAGLQGISDSYYEAADIEGAGEFHKFTRITIPLLSPSLFFISITMLMNAFKAFDIIYVFSGSGKDMAQGPVLNATRTMVYGIFERGFTFMDMGYASAEAVFLFFIILAITAFQFIMQKRWVNYD